MYLWHRRWYRVIIILYLNSFLFLFLFCFDHFGGLRIWSLVFAGDAVLLASWDHDLQLALELSVEKRISASMSKTMVPRQKRVECPLWIWDRLLPEIEKFLGSCSWVRGTPDWQADWGGIWSDADAVCCGEERAEYESKAVDLAVYIPTLTCGHKLWVVTERIRSQVQVMEMSFLRMVSSFSLRNGVRTSE